MIIFRDENIKNNDGHDFLLSSARSFRFTKKEKIVFVKYMCKDNNVKECRLPECLKRRFTQDLHGATSHKTAIFIVTAVKTSNLTTM
jgi:hypothetical protein